MTLPSVSAVSNSRFSTLKMAAWFGLLAGLVEGTALLWFQHLGWMNWRNSWQYAVSVEIIWISAIFNLVLFVAVGLVLAPARRMIPKLVPAYLLVFVFTFLTILDWVILSGRLRMRGALIFALGLAVVATRWYRGHAEATHRVQRWSLPWLVAVALVACFGIEGGLWLSERRAIAALPPAGPNSPNILFVVVDTLRADHMSLYGYGRPTSPRAEKLATEGVVFEKAIAPSSWTLPSHASLVTGRYEYEHGIDGEHLKALDRRYPTIGEELMKLGYRTAGFSGNNYVFGSREGFDRGFIRFEDYFQSVADMAVRTLYGRKFEQFVLRPRRITDIPGRKSAADINRSVLRWIRRDTDKPFFAFLNYFDVHDPYLPPQPYRSKFSKQSNPGGILNTLLDRYYPKLTAEQLQSEVDAYDGGIAYTDEVIGQLLDELEKLGLTKNTIVVFVSDHGESLGEHGLLHHRGSLYREEIHVPLLLRWPGRLPAGVRISQPVSITALPTTLMDLIGHGASHPFPGPSLAGFWQNTPPSKISSWPLPLTELATFPFEVVKKNPSYYGPLKSLIDPQWQYIESVKLGKELYDWEQDPGQLRNLANSTEGESISKTFSEQLKRDLANSRKSGQTLSKQGRTP